MNLEAKTAIWVTPEARPEHQRVIDWLNEVTSEDYAFYLIQVEAVRIGASPFAPLFTVLAAPDEQTREIGETKKELADRHIRRREFWTQLIERSKGRTRLFSARKPGTDHWLGISAGRSGLALTYLIWTDSAGIELYIDTGDQQKNKAIFDALLAQKAAIENQFGEPLNWQRLDEKRASRIMWKIYGHGGLNEPDHWPALQDRLIDAIIRFDKTLRPRIARIAVQ